jgi:hypothetical protein
VRFVEVQLGGWDTHYDNFTAVEGRCKEFDQAYAALITDLEKRGCWMTRWWWSPPSSAARRRSRRSTTTAATTIPPRSPACWRAAASRAASSTGSPIPRRNKVKDGIGHRAGFQRHHRHALGLPHRGVSLMSPTKRPFKIADKGSWSDWKV